MLHKHLVDATISSSSTRRKRKLRFRTRSGTSHRVAKVDARHNRKTIPKVIRNFAHLKGYELPEKIQLTWVVCYLHHIHPNKDAMNWQYFECSHRCISFNLPNMYECVDSKCLVWEAKNKNQSRGHSATFCCKRCTHCDDYLCRCQSLHVPCCI
jgi:hypothetical protein